VSDRKTKVLVFCNSCSPGWHVVVAITEDGRGLASHVCSAHGFGPHDMGFADSTWKHEVYNKHLGVGRWELVWLDSTNPVDLAIIKAIPEYTGHDWPPPKEAAL
jgi:hypothetical protein